MSHTIVFLDRKSLIADLRKPSFPHTWIDHEQTTADEVATRIRDAQILVTNKVKLTGELLAQAPGVKMIAAAATGTDNIDLAYCKANGIVVSNIRNYAVHAVPEHAFMMMLALRRPRIGWPTQGTAKSCSWCRKATPKVKTTRIRPIRLHRHRARARR